MSAGMEMKNSIESVPEICHTLGFHASTNLQKFSLPGTRNVVTPRMTAKGNFRVL